MGPFASRLRQVRPLLISNHPATLPVSASLDLLLFAAGAAVAGLAIYLAYVRRYRQIRFRREYDAKKLWEDLQALMEPVNVRLKKEAGLHAEMTNKVWIEIIFEPAVHVYGQAINCYHFYQLEAAMAMCRNTLDSAIYLGITNIRKKSVTSHEYRKVLPELKGKLGNWKYLERLGLRFGLVDEQTLGAIRGVRKVGNFSAHLAPSQDKEFRAWNERHKEDFKKWQEELKSAAEGRESLDMPALSKVLRDAPPPAEFMDGYKTWTTPNEAWIVLNATGILLIDIITRYWEKDATLSEEPLTPEMLGQFEAR